MINLTFTNGTNTIQLKYVKSVEWSAEFSDEVIVSKTTRGGRRVRLYKIVGFINKGIFEQNVSAQQQLESDLIAVGTGTLQYTGASDVTNVRFKALSFAEFRGNPIAQFTIQFETDEPSVHAHSPIAIGALALTPANGIDYVNVQDSVSSQANDAAINITRKRSFSLQGNLVGATINEVNAVQDSILAVINNQQTVVLTLTGATYTVRCRKVEFGIPKLQGSSTARTFSFECATHDDYSLEPYTLGETSQTFAGITIDLVQSVDHNREFDVSVAGPIYSTKTEELSVSGKRYFISYADYEAFRSSFKPIPTNAYIIISTTGNRLELTDITISAFERDGNFTDTSVRYSANVNLQFKWVKESEYVNVEYGTTHFGVQFYKIQNVSFNSQIDAYGNVTSRSVSVTGEIIGSANLDLLKSKVGTSVDYNSAYTNLYVSSVGVNGSDVINVAGTQIIVYKVNISSQQLDSASQAASFIRGLFKLDRAGGSGTSYSTETIQFENLSSFSKSISNRWDVSTLKFIVTQISLNLSGEVWEQDSGGAPANPTKMIDLLNKLDALMSASLSVQSGANTTNPGEILPVNSDVHYFMTNFSVSGWQSFVKPNSTNAGARYWRQTVSISANAVFDLTGSSNSQPDSIETKSISIKQEAPKYTQLQIAGYGTVFKRIGTTPESAQVSYQKQFRDQRVYVRDDYGADDIIATGWRGINKSVVTEDSKENRNLVNRHTVEYQATEKLGT